MQDQIKENEKKKETTDCPTCQTKKRHRGYKVKTFGTSLGKVQLKRRYNECRSCRLPGSPVDEILGLDVSYTVGLRRLAVRAGTGYSFADASENLKEFCGIKLSHMTVRELCHQEAPKMKEWQDKTPVIPNSFKDATGEPEFFTDGTCVNTTGGWREMKTYIFTKRELGPSALPEEWETRELPEVNCMFAFAAIEKKDIFRRHWHNWRRHLGLSNDISVLADGAHCGISRVFCRQPLDGDAALLEFGTFHGCLDVYHALEHISDLGKKLYKKQEEFKDWYEAMKWVLLKEGWSGMDRELRQLENGVEEKRKKAIHNVWKYFEYHRERLDYAGRLAEGRSIGSGLVEGACKNMIGKRLKQTGARWRVRRVNRMARLCAIRYSDNWKEYWDYAH
jgi:hypothetical protein